MRRPPNCVLILQVRVIAQHSDVSSISRCWRSSILSFYYYFNYYVHSMLSPPFSHLPPIFIFCTLGTTYYRWKGSVFSISVCGSLRAVQEALFLTGFVKVFTCTGLVSRRNGIVINQNFYCGKLQWSEVLEFLASFYFFPTSVCTNCRLLLSSLRLRVV